MRAILDDSRPLGSDVGNPRDFTGKPRWLSIGPICVRGSLNPPGWLKVPVLGTRTPPLMRAAKEGLIEVLGDELLHEKIDNIFRNYARQFCERYSYAANRSRLIDLIEGLRDAPPTLPEEFSRLVAFHDEVRELNAMTAA